VPRVLREGKLLANAVGCLCGDILVSSNIAWVMGDKQIINKRGQLLLGNRPDATHRPHASKGTNHPVTPVCACGALTSQLPRAVITRQAQSCPSLNLDELLRHRTKMTDNVLVRS